jgi:hypothetical protein
MIFENWYKVTLFILITEIVIFVTIYSIIYFPVYNTEIREKGIELGTPQKIHNYLWKNITYEPKYLPLPIWYFWKHRVGDCSEVMNIEYIMIDALDIPVRKCVGFKDKIKHNYNEYYNGTEWKTMDANVTKVGGYYGLS